MQIKTKLIMLFQILFILAAGNGFFNIQPADAYHKKTKTNTNPIIATPLGSIKGSINTTVLGRQIYSFRGIQYAKAPRFQPPVPIEKWDHIYDATKDGPSCPQPGFRPVAEECLFLNVYTTKLPEHGKNPKRPVYVNFHPGGFYFFTGASLWAGPDYIMDQDIVLVTLNYRLGSLGFLATGDHLAPGNYGLKDQVAALKWIKHNIAAFGGDPDLVTLSGCSAGATSNSFHLVSPMSQGLFHRVIMQSASGYSDWRVPTGQFDLAQKQANLVGCPNDTSTNIVKCLKTKSAEELGDTLLAFFTYANNPTLIWKPVIEPDVGQERFLSEDPINLVECGKFAKVPILAGITEHEFDYAAFRIVGNETLLRTMDEDFNTIGPICFLYDEDRSEYVSPRLRKFYLGDGPLTNSSLTGIGNLYADSVIGFSVNRAARLLAAKNTEPVFYYKFSYYGRYSYFYLPGTNSTPIGAVHHDDLMYLYYISPLFPRFTTSDPEYTMVQKLTKMHADFALTGNPIPTPTSELDNVNWQQFTNQNNKYLDIGNKLVMKENMFKDRYDEWDKLFPLTGCLPEIANTKTFKPNGTT